MKRQPYSEASRSALIGLLVALAGCGAQSEELGSDPRAAAASLEGTWTTTLSGSAFVSNPKPLSLQLDATGNGTLLVGDQRLPPPTDPAIAFPPEAEADAAEASGMLLHLYEGIEYSLIGVQMSDQRLHFEIDAIQAFEASCDGRPIGDRSRLSLPRELGRAGGSLGGRQTMPHD